MASKILVVGSVDGQFRTVFQKIAALHAKNSFAFALVVGNLFADPAAASADDEINVQALLYGNIEVPLTTYFALGGHGLPAAITKKLESSDDEVCSNLYFLGKRSVFKTSNGIRIVALGGHLDANIISGPSKDKYPPFYGEADAKVLRGANHADILITNEWPAGIRTRSKVELSAQDEPTGQPCIADLCSALKPRYHFSTSQNAYYEREPFFHTPSQETDGLYPITRFISLASFGNPQKQKWIYAFSLDPTASHPVSPPSVSTASPLIASEKKRAAPADSHQSGLVHDDGHRGRRPHKKRRGDQRGPPTAAECFFCLANDNVATHLVTSIGEHSYMTTAKGPLPTQDTFPKLGFPGHLLIIPLTHQSTLAAMEEEERHNTYAEMQKYRASMNSMLKNLAGEEYGSVTWEVSKTSLPHTHWQYLPIPANLIQSGLLEQAFKVLAENLHYPPFKAVDIGDGFEETNDFFRVLIWNPKTPETEAKSLVMALDESIRFHLQFGREVIGKLMKLDRRIDWRDCGQTQPQEEADVAAFKEAFKTFDFAD